MVLVAEDLAPADTAGLDADIVHALVTEKGGPTSHTAIIARQLAIPCVVGTPGALELANGTRLLVDGTAGTIETDPDAEDADRRWWPTASSAPPWPRGPGPGRTKDGAPVKLLANVADGGRPARPCEQPIEGVGLFRTELCFLDRSEEPSVEEQTDIYAEVLEPFGDRGSTSSCARSTRAPTSPSPSRRSRARRTPPSASAACACRGATRRCWNTSWTASRAPPTAPAPRPG